MHREIRKPKRKIKPNGRKSSKGRGVKILKLTCACHIKVREGKFSLFVFGIHGRITTQKLICINSSKLV